MRRDEPSEHASLLDRDRKSGRNYSAYSPDLLGRVATGKTRDQATRNMYEAMEIHVRGLLEDKFETSM